MTGREEPVVRIFIPCFPSYDVALSWLGPQESFDLPKEIPLELSLLSLIPLVFLGVHRGKS